MRPLAVVYLLLVTLFATPTDTNAAVPLEDDGFAAVTPPPDPDLIVVRERAYGAAGVDLTPYGIGAGSAPYVQSIYFRFYVDGISSSIDSFTGRVTFTPGVEILGIITDGAALGGSADDGAATETDLIFGVATDPNDYSEDFRGFECCGGSGSSEFVCQTSPTSFVYGLNIGDGVDDFRVIIAYTDSFTAGQSFDITAFDIPSLGGAAPSEGIRVGNDSAPAVPGSGDFGEIGGLIHIPLTSAIPPTPSGPISFDPFAGVFILRNTSGATYVDGFDLEEQLPAPDIYSLSGGTIGNPVGITDGPDSLLYAVGRGAGYSVVDAVAESVVTNVLLANLTGNNVDVTNLPGLPSLYILRDASDTYVDHLDPATLTYVDVDTVPGATVSDAISITDAADGMLYILGASGALVRLDPVTGVQDVLTPLSIPAGSYVSLTGAPNVNELYLLRTDGMAHIDRYDIDLDVLTPDVATVPAMTAAVSITDVTGDRLVAVGRGSSGPALLAELDRASMTILNESACLDFAGSNVSLTNVDAGGTTVSIPPDGPVAGLDLAQHVYPNPFSSLATIRYRLPEPSHVELVVFDLSGRRVARLENAVLPAGVHHVRWNGRDAMGRSMDPGMYLYRLRTAMGEATGRLTLLH